MGVFYLGEIVRKQFESERKKSSMLCKKIKSSKIDKLGKIFSLACLLHDVGHAPFSHTGEGFYLHLLENGSGKSIRIRLLCDDDIISLSKSLLDDSLVDEYFERKERRHPLWKSEAEYNACIENDLEGKTIRAGKRSNNDYVSLFRRKEGLFYWK